MEWLFGKRKVCETCRYWSQSTGDDAYRYCYRLNGERAGITIISVVDADVVRSVMSEVRTAHDFGCNLWQGK